jgi:hypothetical protein
MAGGAAFPLDQNAFARKGLLRDLGKRSQVAELDRRIGLRARRYHQEATQSLSQSVRSATEKTPLDVALSRLPTASESAHDNNQLILL